jgi:rhamnogalacturonyl hydrolase YesR
MTKVADWSLRHFETRFTQDWTYVPLYSGLLAASEVTGNQSYHDAVLRMAERFHWQLLPGRYDHADDEALGQIYEALYEEKSETIRLAAVQQNFNQLLARKDDPDKELWWWCDALYMAPPSLGAMSEITGDRKYLAFMDHEVDLTTKHLYSPTEDLYFRDPTFLPKTEKNGRPLFWSRGNGWVLAGTAHLLSTMSKTDPLRPKYEKRFREMAARIASLQPADGLWRAGLLDADAYSQGEVSGTGLFTYAMAWGINQNILDRATFTPVVRKAWAGMLLHVYQDGRLGNIQPIGAAPGVFSPGSSYVYGVGAFLMAGSEIDKMASRQ